MRTALAEATDDISGIGSGGVSQQELR